MGLCRTRLQRLGHQRRCALRLHCDAPPLSRGAPITDWGTRTDNTLTMFFSAVWSECVGGLAATLTTASFVPQVWLTFRSRDVSGISLGMYSLFTVGVALWLLYGISLGAWPVIAANAVTLTLALCILGMRLRYGGERRPD